MSSSLLASCTESSGLNRARPESNPQALPSPCSGSSCDLLKGSLRKPLRLSTRRRSWSTIMPSSRSFEALLERTKATFTGKLESQHRWKAQRIPYAKTVTKSLSHGSVTLNSACGRPPQSDAGALRYHRPVSCCFTRRQRNAELDDKELSQLRFFSDTKAENKAEQINMAQMSLEERLAQVNSMKGKTYSLHTGFALARTDALQMLSLLRCGRASKRTKKEGGDADAEADAETFSRLLTTQAKVLSGACAQMAAEYGSPEELLLTLTHSFHTLCCLAQACMSLEQGLRGHAERRQLGAKVDQVLISYVRLLKAAEASLVSPPEDPSVKALTHHSANMSAIIDALIHLMTTLCNK